MKSLADATPDRVATEREDLWKLTRGVGESCERRWKTGYQSPSAGAGALAVLGALYSDGDDPFLLFRVASGQLVSPLRRLRISAAVTGIRLTARQCSISDLEV